MARYTINGGPSKWDLMVSTFEGNPLDKRHLVTFKVFDAPVSEIDVAITGIDQEDGSGESWIFRGYTRYGESPNVNGYYSTKHRRGYIDVSRRT